MSSPRAPYRLCFVNSMRTWGGAEVWMLETALALRERGQDVDFITNPDSELHKRAVAAGLSVKPINIQIDGAPWTIAAMASHFRGSGTTALIANRTKDVFAAAPAGRLAGVPIILATRESDFPLKDKFNYRLGFKNMCTGLLVNSQATRQTILDSAPWLDSANVHLLFKGIDVARFTPGPRVEGPPVVGFVGQLIDRKGIFELMAAWSNIDQQERTERPQLRLAGEGILKADLEEWRLGLRFPEAVSILGYAEEVENFYRGLHILVMPSHKEGFGLAAAEALACSVPVIAGRASSLPEIVHDEVNGLLVPPGDSEALTVALTRLLDDPDWCRKLGATGHAWVNAEFPQEGTLDRLLMLTGHPDYQSLAQERS